MWHVAFLCYGPRLAINHDELNFLHEALRLPAEHRVSSYTHGPLLAELIAFLEIIAYVVFRLAGRVDGPQGFLTDALVNLQWHLLAARAVVGLVAVGVLAAVYRLGRLFGGPWVGVAASIMCATNLTFVAMAAVCKEEPLFWILWVLASVEAWRAAESGNVRHAVLAGATIGAAIAAKLFGVFLLLLAALPFLAVASKSAGAIRSAATMVLAAGCAVVLLHPFVLTDTHRVLELVGGMAASASAAPSIEGPLLGTYLFTHLPNLVGPLVGVVGLTEAVRRLALEPRGPVLLGAAPVALLAFMGLRRGYSMAYYIFPFALLLIVLAASLTVRMLKRIRSLGWRCAVGGALALLLGSDPAFLRGSFKHALVLMAPDTRLLAQAYVVHHLRPGSCVAITEGLRGYNIWGPPLVGTAAPDGTGRFAEAEREARSRVIEPRFNLRLLDNNSREELGAVGCDWLVRPGFSWSPIELGPAPPGRGIHPDFQVVADFEAAPMYTHFFPFYTTADYRALRATSISRLMRSPGMPWRQTIFHRQR